MLKTKGYTEYKSRSNLFQKISCNFTQKKARKLLIKKITRKFDDENFWRPSEYLNDLYSSMY